MQTSDNSVTWTDLLNQYLRRVLGCILMASSKVLSKDVGVCLSALPAMQQGRKQYPAPKVTGFHPGAQGRCRSYAGGSSSTLSHVAHLSQVY